MTSELGVVEAIAGRLARVQERVHEAAARAGRDPAGVAIVAVSKRHGAEVLAAGFAAGVGRVGENYAQELVAKLDQVACAAELEWHFVGRLQRNKARYVAGRVALIHAVDSLDVAREIDRRARCVGAGQPGEGGASALVRGKQRVLVAVNMAGEEQKSGVAPGAARDFLAAMAELEHVDCAGLMTMPPLAERAEDSRRYFRALAELRAALATAAQPLPELSMGTTFDFEVAVEEGATLVRVGTAIFGSRPG
jgi:PLP dependent protein